MLDGSRLTYVRNGNENDLQNVREWHIRLYRRGESTSTNSYGWGGWGLITGNSAASVTRQLKLGQEIELMCERLCRECPKVIATHFNPLGPIAVVEKRNSEQKAKDKTTKIVNRYKDIISSYQTANRWMIGYEEWGENKMRDVGITFKEYADNFKDVFRKMSDLQKFMEKVTVYNEQTMHELDTFISEMDHIESKSQQLRDKLSADLDRQGGEKGAKGAGLRDATGKEIEQVIENDRKRLFVSQKYRGGEPTTYKVALADIDRSRLNIKSGPAPGTWVVQVRGAEDSIEKNSPMIGKRITDSISMFEVLFASKKEAQHFMASLKGPSGVAAPTNTSRKRLAYGYLIVTGVTKDNNGRSIRIKGVTSAFAYCEDKPGYTPNDYMMESTASTAHSFQINFGVNNYTLDPVEMMRPFKSWNDARDAAVRELKDSAFQKTIKLNHYYPREISDRQCEQ